jgi:iron complex outermembrane recepter protein
MRRPLGAYCMKARSRLVLAYSTVLATALSAALAQGAVAAEERLQFDIPEGDAGRALQMFAKQSGEQILFPYDAVQGRHTPAVQGKLAAPEVLHILSAAAGLVELSNDGHTITLGSPPTQSAPPPPPSPQAAAPVGVEELIVTALKHATGVQTTPVSITALSGASLDASGATALVDYVRQVPNLVLTQGNVGQNRISIRGIQSNGEATVGLYYDETPISGPSATNGDPGGNVGDINLYDIERVEVLRGPQGTLYGAGSMGGTLRVIFNKPNSTTYQASAETQYETTHGGSDGYYAKGMANIPLMRDKLALRVVAYGETRPGWVDNIRFGYKDVNESRSSGVRSLLAFTPTDDITITGTYIYQKQRTNDTEPWRESLGTSNGNSPVLLPYRSSLQLYNITAKWNLPFATLTATSSEFRYGLLRTVDFSPSVSFSASLPPICQAFYAQAAPCSPTQASQFRNYAATRLPAIGWQPGVLNSSNTEIRLSSNLPGPLSWTIGAYHERRRDSIVSNIAVADPATGATPMPLNDTSNRYVRTVVHQTSEFGELSYTPITPLTLTVGLRHYNYDKTVAGAVVLGSVLTGTATAPLSSASANADGWIPKVNLSYKVNPALFAYATASKGFRPGGANNIPGLPARLVAYQPDSLWNYEVGLKTTWFQGRLVLNGAAYDIQWRNLQTQASASSGLYAFLTNAGSAEVKGGELEATARPIPSLILNASVGVADARLTSDQVNADILPSGSTGRKGDRMPFVPNVTASASISYQHPITETIDGLARLDYSYVGDMTSQFSPSYIYFERFGRFSTLGARIGIETQGGSISLFVQNLTNAVGLNNKTAPPFAGVQSFGIMPRTIGVNLQKSF